MMTRAVDLAYVCGLGESWVRHLDGPQGTVFGVNDCGRYFVPDRLVCIDGPQSFRGDRWDYIKNHGAVVAHSQLDLDIPRLERIELNPNRGVFMDPRLIDVSHTSVFVACGIAWREGFRVIAVCGSDFRGHHLTPNLPEMLDHYRSLAAALSKRDVRLVSIVEDSPMNRALPYVDPKIL